MRTDQRILLEKIMRDTSPMEVLWQMTEFIKKESQWAKSGTEVFGLRKIASSLDVCANKINTILGNLREYQPKHRVYSSQHYSPRHAKEIFKS